MPRLPRAAVHWWRIGLRSLKRGSAPARACRAPLLSTGAVRRVIHTTGEGITAALRQQRAAALAAAHVAAAVSAAPPARRCTNGTVKWCSQNPAPDKRPMAPLSGPQPANPCGIMGRPRAITAIANFNRTPAQAHAPVSDKGSPDLVNPPRHACLRHLVRLNATHPGRCPARAMVRLDRRGLDHATCARQRRGKCVDAGPGQPAGRAADADADRRRRRLCV